MQPGFGVSPMAISSCAGHAPDFCSLFKVQPTEITELCELRRRRVFARKKIQNFVNL